MNDFLVSIIVPCYNASYYIKEVLESLQNQSYKNIECIIINDGSADDTLDIINTFSDPRFKVYSQKNKGLSDTRNFGMEEATGDLIFFCDSDDSLPSNAIESLLSAHTGKEDIIVGKTALVSWEEKKTLSYLPHLEKKQTIENSHSEVLIKNITEGLSPMAQNKLYKTDFLKKNSLQFLSKIYHEDELWFFEVMFAAKNVTFIPDVTYHYTADNSQSITKKNSDKNLLGYLSVIKTIYEKYYLNFPDQSIIAYYIVYLKKIIIGNYKHHGNYSSEAIQEMEKTFREVNPKFNDNIELSNTEKKYFKFLNNVSLKDAETIKKEYFNLPVNSLRKHYKLLLFSIFNSK
ncbi:glycosyltransferase family 2 protein [Chryseobacterium sp. G0186]|uniref:glycosyltransferase family 2 protein n=1 Tax=Chryseobacterium sp. G0186 TaxID=2487064 RepID=UPI000F4FB954|nr:glycosyltransferase family 2 protein [Chryseobacterium sp. G0186]AZA78213.1 glycosyltransferase family 2 protein [Chryseobacterium sp. G0186]